jgi:hypothetical protein
MMIITVTVTVPLAGHRGVRRRRAEGGRPGCQAVTVTRTAYVTDRDGPGGLRVYMHRPRARWRSGPVRAQARGPTRTVTS